MYRIVIAGFKQETNTFSPKVCTMSDFLASWILEGQELIDTMINGQDEVAATLHVLQKAGAQIIPSTCFRSQSSGRVEQGICTYFINRLIKTIRENQPIDGVFLNLHGGMSLTEDDDGIGYILAEVRKEVGPDVVIAVSSDLHANITKRVIGNLDVLCGWLEYPHTDIYETGERMAKLGLYCLDHPDDKPALAFAKIPMILQAECGNTKVGPLKEIVDHAKSLVRNGTLTDYTMYHMQPWMDIKEAGASVVTMARDGETARAYAVELANLFFEYGKAHYNVNEDLDKTLDLVLAKAPGKLFVISDASDNVSGGATGDSVNVLRRILEREMDIRAACVIADPDVPFEAEALGVGAEAEFTVGGKYDPAYYTPITIRARVEKIPDPVVREFQGSFKGRASSFGKAAILRVRNTDVIVVKQAQFNYSPAQFVGFGLDPADYDLLVVKSSLAYREPFKHYTDELHTVETPGSCSSDLKNMDFKRIDRPMYPFDDMKDHRITDAVLATEL